MRLQHLQNQFESAVLTAQKTPVSRNPWIYPQTVVQYQGWASWRYSLQNDFELLQNAP